MDQSPYLKSTPGRRRAGRTQRSYASEGDVPSVQSYQQTQNPCTPQRPGHLAHTRSDQPQYQQQQQQQQTGQRQPSTQKQRNRQPKSNNKKSVPASSPRFGVAENNGRPSPTGDGSLSRYAGSTFTNSPAASSLPIPSFVPKTSPTGSPSGFDTSSPELPAAKLLSSQKIMSKKMSSTGPSQEPSPPTTDSESDDVGYSSPLSFQPPSRANEPSPLDMFFQADRAEKARARRASSANVLSVPTGPFSPPRFDEAQEPNSFPRVAGPVPNRRPQISQRNMSTGIPANELDGTPGAPVGPAFSAPFHERIRAARSNKNSIPSSPHQQQQQQQTFSQQADAGADLMRFLTTKSAAIPTHQQQPSPPNMGQGLPSPQATPPRMPSKVFPPPAFSELPPQHRSVFQSPSIHDPVTSDQLRSMEDSIRRMLKLSS